LTKYNLVATDLLLD